MKKIFTILLCGLLAANVFCISSKDVVIEEFTNNSGLTFKVFEEADDDIFDKDIYILVTDKMSKDSILKIDVDDGVDYKRIITDLENEIGSYKKHPLESFIKSSKRKGEWEKDRRTGLKYFELDDDYFPYNDDDLYDLF